ncbi:hypothetical protein K435DRAFT_792660 [Dendrothele bispora CBS 962.96]|uniref:Uncharacterized protein n=1 Tax=Dendrothele bispora (strain CBS 962.96) TaxID=1314807 RepID=A0A4S8MIA5_DENBC|nr:hypothetical protein K435DRAFT_792660 [Dendrothele bispora CBS 962.96]
MRIKNGPRKVSAQLRQSRGKSVGSSGNPSDYHPWIRIDLKATHHPSGCHPNPTQSDPVGALPQPELSFKWLFQPLSCCAWGVPFCPNFYHVSGVDKERLEMLEYKPGNQTIKKLDKADWSEAGFKPLLWASLFPLFLGVEGSYCYCCMHSGMTYHDISGDREVRHKGCTDHAVHIGIIGNGTKFNTPPR